VRQGCIWCFCPTGFLQHTAGLAGGSAGAAARVSGRRLGFFGLTEETRDGCSWQRKHEMTPTAETGAARQTNEGINLTKSKSFVCQNITGFIISLTGGSPCNFDKRWNP
jgi:hypothetical protein